MIFVDVETSGLDPKKNALLSIGACTLDDGNTFYGACRLRPGAQISPQALKINGFSREQIQNPSLLDSCKLYFDFLQWCRDQDDLLLAGENVGTFDVAFLQEEHTRTLRRLGAKENVGAWPFGYRYIDLHSCGVMVLGASESLDKRLKRLGLAPEPQPHNALTGALKAKETYLSLIEIVSLLSGE